jgi:single-strand DNA-binding protein
VDQKTKGETTMSRGVNRVTLLGNVGKNPEIRYTQSGTAVANFSLAVGERRKVGNEWKDHTEWFSIVAWSKLAETCSNYLSKGKQVYIEGRLQTRKWDDRDGNTRYSTEIVADQLVLLGGKEARTEQQGPRGEPAGPNHGFDDPNTECPF